ncbi:MAG: helix-turn-helix domain-containing protein [Candidatus Aenigmarchaeota archaeon]|nr:helix-turn-helix domain-containing protein [Candidatus Aenigmarchaeota archaeon]
MPMNKCEQAVSLFPTIRAAIARKLINENGVSQAKVAEALGITQAAVSQYMKSVRGKQLLQNPEIDEKISAICREFIENKKYPDLSKEFCKCKDN